ncbi:MAG: class II aldolase/adducin family protein [Bacteroidales bacterium]|nr:class II aldolase/adducin family protein [Bacteroidales bacterium]
MLREEIDRIRNEVAFYMRRLYKKGLTTALGGNISAKLEHGILITPSSTDKGLVRKSQIGFLSFDTDGMKALSAFKPTIESYMHLELYKIRPDINAVVHAHPPLASAFTAMNSKINCNLIAESRAVLGSPVIADYAPMGSKELAAVVADAARNANVILLKNHGVVCLGENLLTAYSRMEVLEAAAKMTIITMLLNDSCPLSKDQIREIDRLLSKYV